MKRISFSQYDATRILEWKYAMNQGLGESCCEYCTSLEKRLEKIVENPKRLKAMVKKYPYFPHPHLSLFWG